MAGTWRKLPDKAPATSGSRMNAASAGARGCLWHACNGPSTAYSNASNGPTTAGSIAARGRRAGGSAARGTGWRNGSAPWS